MKIVFVVVRRVCVCVCVCEKEQFLLKNRKHFWKYCVPHVQLIISIIIQVSPIREFPIKMSMIGIAFFVCSIANSYASKQEQYKLFHTELLERAKAGASYSDSKCDSVSACAPKSTSGSGK